MDIYKNHNIFFRKLRIKTLTDGFLRPWSSSLYNKCRMGPSGTPGYPQGCFPNMLRKINLKKFSWISRKYLLWMSIKQFKYTYGYPLNKLQTISSKNYASRPR